MAKTEHTKTPSPKTWIIICNTGWGSKFTATRFTTKQSLELNLPVDGRWIIDLKSKGG